MLVFSEILMQIKGLCAFLLLCVSFCRIYENVCLIDTTFSSVRPEVIVIEQSTSFFYERYALFCDQAQTILVMGFREQIGVMNRLAP
ncbi:Secreted protein [Parendozoicomonas haliclonae]|uniref:Uncharacterized protein n=1 Tax=Parendozoicomonas haliclonae TaxID=1960125 RepID=A0A1X7ALW0_9GAMM|nr:hypothetical protein EHSB41UT_02860 [Parendozoicomonas haliclonae]